jgi:hypothetical protein
MDDNNSVKRKPNGKGKSKNPATQFKNGNPGGGRPKVPLEVKEAARAQTQDAIAILAHIMKNPKARDADRIHAAEILLNRAWGSPVQSVDIAPPLTVIFDTVLKDKNPA